MPFAGLRLERGGNHHSVKAADGRYCELGRGVNVLTVRERKSYPSG
jgi:hypothetical protein